MKDLRLEYTFPKSLVKKTKVFQNLSVAAFATNLFCLTAYPFYDPDTGVLVGGDIKRGVETGSFPMCRSYGANLKIKF